MREYGGDCEPAPRVPRSRPRRERRSRVLAVIALVVVAVVLLVVGLTGGSSDSGETGGGETTPFSVLPITPQTGSDTSDSTTTTSAVSQFFPGQDDAAATATGEAGGPLVVAGGDAGGDAGDLTSTGTTLLKAGASTLSRSASSLVTAMAVASADDVPVLMYHYVADVPPPTGPYASGLTVRTGDFDDQMRYLADNGYQTISLGDLYLARQGLKSLPSKPVILTFDDGGLDNYHVAFPILAKYGLQGSFFVITGRVGAAGQMDWDDLAAMAKQGMSIESHTVSHPTDLRTVDDSRLAKELDDSRDAIAQNLGLAPESLSYPCGKSDARVHAAAKAAGYLMAVSTTAGTDAGADADYQIRRVRVAAFESIEDFSSSLQ